MTQGSNDDRKLWPSYGALAVDWIQDNLIHGEGDFYGKPFELLDDQILFLYRWYEHDPESGRWRYQRSLKGEPKGNGKTEFVAAISCLEFAGPPEIAPQSPEVVVAAASLEQANILFRQCKLMLTSDEAPLQQFFEGLDRVIRFRDGRPGMINRVAAADGTNDGKRPTLFIADEVHEWTTEKQRAVHKVLRNGLPKRNPGGRELDISTAGAGRGSVPPVIEEDSLLWIMYAEGLMQRDDPLVSPRYLFDWKEAAEHWDLNDPDQLRAAIRECSPAADKLWDVEDRAERWSDPKVTSSEFKRYFLNQFVDVGEDTWLADHPTAWNDLAGDPEFPEGCELVLGVDMALHQDSTSVVWDYYDGEKHNTKTRVWTAGEGKINHLEVFEYIKNLKDKYNLRVTYDPRFFVIIADMLEEEGIETIEFKQSIESMAPACQYAFEQIMTGHVVHDGDRTFASHVNAAVRRETDRGWTLHKIKSKKHIDACIAFVMAAWEASQGDLVANSIW